MHTVNANSGEPCGTVINITINTYSCNSAAKPEKEQKPKLQELGDVAKERFSGPPCAVSEFLAPQAEEPVIPLEEADQAEMKKDSVPETEEEATVQEESLQKLAEEPAAETGVTPTVVVHKLRVTDDGTPEGEFQFGFLDIHSIKGGDFERYAIYKLLAASSDDFDGSFNTEELFTSGESLLRKQAELVGDRLEMSTFHVNEATLELVRKISH